jgi:WD40 repeat protein
MGQKVYPHAQELLITADAGGSNGYRVKLWKRELQKLANETGLRLMICAALLLRPITGFQENPLWELPLPAGAAHPVDDLKVSDATYTPDDRLLYSQRNNLFIAESDGSKARKLVGNVEGFLVSASMSPDGSRIAFASFTPNGLYGFVAKSDGSELHPLRNLTAHADWGGSMCWSPDGKYLIVPKKEGDSTDLWLVPVDTGLFSRLSKPMRLTRGPLNFNGASVTPDGKQIITVGSSDRGELVRYQQCDQAVRPFPGRHSGVQSHLLRRWPMDGLQLLSRFLALAQPHRWQ